MQKKWKRINYIISCRQVDSKSDNESLQSNKSDPDLKAEQKIENSKKWKCKIVQNENTAAMLGRTSTSDRKAALVVNSAEISLDQNIAEKTSSKSSIQRARKKKSGKNSKSN